MVVYLLLPSWHVTIDSIDSQDEAAAATRTILISALSAVELRRERDKG